MSLLRRKSIGSRGRFHWWLLCAAMLGCDAFGSPAEGEGEGEGEVDGFAIDLNYSHEEMFGFSIEQFCRDDAPHLLPYAEMISHVAGRTRVSPRALLALMEEQSGAVSNPHFVATKAFGDLATPGEFLAQVEDISRRLRGADRGSDMLLEVDAPDKSILEVVPEKDVKALAMVYRKLFPGVVGQRALVEKASAIVPMQFPFAAGTSWRFGGAHADDGSGATLNSIDFSQNWPSWGETVTVNVVASAGGRVKKHSSCYVEIIHNDTWSTGYYHLSDIMVANGATVKANQPIAKYANRKSQALCEGGSSTGPHVHWTLWSGDRPANLSGKVLSGWTIHPGTSNYDENCARMYLLRNGQKFCVGPALRNDGISSQPPTDQCPNDPKKTDPGQCGCGSPEPVDVSGYRDAQGYSCSDWVGYDCTRAAAEEGYTSAQQTSILRNCKASCNICP